MNKFVIIGGMPRSGTNLTRRIIGSHSKIAIPPAEFQFFSQYANGKSVTDILTHERLERWRVDLSDLCSQEHREAFITALARYTENAGKEIPGEKTPNNEFYYDIIQEWLSDFELKFVHVVRNPFDTMASFKHFHQDNRRQGDYPGLPAHSRNWVRSTSMGLARAHNNPRGYYLLKYEDLATDPTSTTQDLCAFLGVDFERERMLNLSDFQGRRDNTSFPQDRGAEHEGYAAIRKPESRKHYLTDAQVHIVSSICGELAHALGYDDDDFGPSFPEHTDLGIIKRLSQAVRNLVPFTSIY
ncbi:MAG: sulfotransferase [Chloroflexota bacterium]|nr:sulfotransferase [Chloroflexota bacterium]